MGLLATPALLNKGYQKEMTSGIICAAGTLGILIPPSIMMVVYGGLTGLKETSVGNPVRRCDLSRACSSRVSILSTF
jgi:TRAP-type mannitol/chloroaromatic compound transport system permease large subunit